MMKIFTINRIIYRFVSTFLTICLDLKFTGILLENWNLSQKEKNSEAVLKNM